MSSNPSGTAACCLVHQLGKCDAVFTCCDRCPTFFADRAKPIYGKPFHGWSCDCDECKGYDERGEPRPGEAPRPQASAAPVWLVLDSRGQVVSVAGSQSVADSIKRLHESHGFGPYRIEQWAVRRDLAKTPEAVNAN